MRRTLYCKKCGNATFYFQEEYVDEVGTTEMLAKCSKCGTLHDPIEDA